MTTDLVPATSVPSDLDPKMERAALALAYRFSQKDAGKLAGVEDRTIRRWLTNPEFVALVAAYRARPTSCTSHSKELSSPRSRPCSSCCATARRP
jgi:hypothetical protein